MRGHLRDRHTFIYSIALPLFLYPLLFLGLAQAVFIARGAGEHRIARVALLDGSFPPGFAEHLAGQKKLRVVPAPAPVSAADARAVKAWIDERKLEAALQAAPDAEGRPAIFIHYSGARDGSAAALTILEDAIARYRKQLLLQEAAGLGEGERFLESVRVERVDLRPRDRRMRDELARLVPLFLLMMACIGAFYPSLDTTVGERERGTLETTLLCPVDRRALILGKYLPVVALSVLSVVLNLVSLGLALRFFLFQVDAGLAPSELPPLGLLHAFAGTVLLSLLVSAVMLAVALIARSFKEGQSYLGPVLLLVIVPGIAASVEELRLDSITALTPLLNLALTVRDALQDRLSPMLALEAYLSAAAYTILAIAFASRLAGREELLLGVAAVRTRRGLFAFLRRRPSSV